MSRALGALVATAIAVLVMTPAAAPSPQGPKYQLTARLLPREIVGRPPDVGSAARGAFSATLNAFWRDGQTIRPHVRYSDTTDVTRIHIHAGEPGTNGSILYTVCASTSRSHPIACRSPLGFFNWGFFAWVPDIVHRPAYVDVHTKRNPRGELRGQLTVRRVS